MRMVTKIAVSNMKYHKSKNILTGIAIFLTTLLLFLVPTIGMTFINGQYAVVNEIYPIWHALYRDVDEETVEKLAVHHDIGCYGIRGDVGEIKAENADILMMYLDEEGAALYKMELEEGSLPEAENEIVVSEGILKALGLTGKIGDSISIPCQIYRDGGLDVTEEKEFVICGFLNSEESEETEESKEEKKAYSAFVSKAFLEKEIPKEQITYRFLFQIAGEQQVTTDEIESRIDSVAAQFGIEENGIGVNEQYLRANYVDPAFVPIMAGIMVIIVFAGIITIYSIYYVSMGERVQEFGKIKAIGATKRQIRQIVLREGFSVAFVAIPIGLLVGTVAAKVVFLEMLKLYSGENIMASTMGKLFVENKITVYQWWIYLVAIAVTLITVYASLRKPMRVMARVSEIEAIRYQAETANGSRKKRRKGYCDITIFRLAKIYLTGNKKKGLITICSMGMTGIFLMVVATVLSCADPVECTNGAILEEYLVTPLEERGNREHPEREWSSIQQNNPLTEELKIAIEQIEGIEGVEVFSKINATSESFGEETEGIAGVPEFYKKELENGIIEGSATYEDLLAGDKVIIDKNLLYWHPDIKLGDTLNVMIEDGDSSYEKELEIIAIGDYSIGFTNYAYLLMAQDAVKAMSENNLNFYYHVSADKRYDKTVEEELKELVAGSELLEMTTWQESYEMYKAAMSMTSGACYAFLGILGVICIMNMVNTMIHSVHVRKKEIGMLQAIGMSDEQLLHMLQLEGLFYTIGTLVISIGFGSLLGYPVFLWARYNAMFNIRNYHYPVEAAGIISVVLLVVQLVLAIMLGRSVKKESLIERVRFSE